jgi:exopolysaccharide production protein ExoZ
VIVNIQVLRAVAALMVVCFHFLLSWQRNQAGTYPAWLDPSVGAAGVDLFFVISGFIMLETTREGKTGPVSFLRKRLIRIAPLYWLLVVLLAAKHHGDATQFDWRWLVQSLPFLPHVEGTMEGATFPVAYFPILFVGWTLTFEMFFYVVFAGALLFRRSPYWPLAVPTFFVLVVVVAQSTRNPYAVYYSHSIILEFLYGMAIAAFRPPSSWQEADSPLLAVFLIGAGCLGMIGSNSGMLATSEAVTLADGLSAAAIVYGAVHLERQGYVATNRLLLSIGAASYSLYLIHTVLLSKLDGLLAAFPAAHFLAALGIYSAALAFTVVIALLSYTLFERPTQRVLTRLFNIGQPESRGKKSPTIHRPWHAGAKAVD